MHNSRVKKLAKVSVLIEPANHGLLLPEIYWHVKRYRPKRKLKEASAWQAPHCRSAFALCFHKH
jgi:hypothetical protein